MTRARRGRALRSPAEPQPEADADDDAAGARPREAEDTGGASRQTRGRHAGVEEKDSGGATLDAPLGAGLGRPTETSRRTTTATTRHSWALNPRVSNPSRPQGTRFPTRAPPPKPADLAGTSSPLRATPTSERRLPAFLGPTALRPLRRSLRQSHGEGERGAPA